MSRPLIIAEAGVNHNGSLANAIALVDVAVECGADVVKFQTFTAAALATSIASKADYQKRTVGTQGSQLEMLKKLELSADDHRALLARCNERGISFLSTPFDHESLRLLVTLGVERLKTSSGDLTNLPLLREIGAARRPCIISTGMGDLGDVEAALGAVASGALASPGERISWRDALTRDDAWAFLAKNVSLLHCTTEYPAPLETINLRAMDTLAAAFGLPVGYSDHSTGITVPIAAAARGAAVIEKHFTLDRKMEGPDHAASLEPDELRAMVLAVRDVELALGSSRKQSSPTERRNMAPARRSLVATAAIARGEAFTLDNLGAKRPGTGISPMRYDEYLGSPAQRSYEVDELIDD